MSNGKELSTERDISDTPILHYFLAKHQKILIYLLLLTKICLAT